MNGSGRMLGCERVDRGIRRLGERSHRGQLKGVPLRHCQINACKLHLRLLELLQFGDELAVPPNPPRHLQRPDGAISEDCSTGPLKRDHARIRDVRQPSRVRAALDAASMLSPSPVSYKLPAASYQQPLRRISPVKARHTSRRRHFDRGIPIRHSLSTLARLTTRHHGVTLPRTQREDAILDWENRSSLKPTNTRVRICDYSIKITRAPYLRRIEDFKRI